MKIVITGVESTNKGAELMLYAILQQIEQKFPKATVYVPWGCKISQIKTRINIKYSPNYVPMRIFRKLRLLGILKKLDVFKNWLSYQYPIKDVDLFLDANGFYFSDQWNLSDQNVEGWRMQLEGYKKQGTKIVFLPQAFGPAQLNNTQRVFNLFDRYADLVIPREPVSYDYIKPYISNDDKIFINTDFTATIDGVVPKAYDHLRGKVCIIPNSRMMDKGSLTFEKYVEILKRVIETSRKAGKDCYLLNHEGKADEQLANRLAKTLNCGIEVVSGLSSLEVKGVISTAYLCVSSRFHGVASALNGCVPCLATSWSHKYEELYKDYNLHDCLLDLSDTEKSVLMVTDFLAPQKNELIRNQLKTMKPQILSKVNNMWNRIWAL